MHNSIDSEDLNLKKKHHNHSREYTVESRRKSLCARNKLRKDISTWRKGIYVLANSWIYAHICLLLVINTVAE
ncbi:hypothetical protein Mapa_010475 [Marchantia paleacea]|nr:hypothetical protein Mapa_010475 [Marchantia paleacea]